MSQVETTGCQFSRCLYLRQRTAHYYTCFYGLSCYCSWIAVFVQLQILQRAVLGTVSADSFLQCFSRTSPANSVDLAAQHFFLVDFVVTPMFYLFCLFGSSVGYAHCESTSTVVPKDTREALSLHLKRSRRFNFVLWLTTPYSWKNAGLRGTAVVLRVWTWPCLRRISSSYTTFLQVFQAILSSFIGGIWCFFIFLFIHSGTPPSYIQRNATYIL